MLGFQSPAVEIELAKAVRASEIQAAERFHLRRVVRRSARKAAAAKNRGGITSTPRSMRPAADGIGGPRRSSG
jgi:hypothetical protein